MKIAAPITDGKYIELFVGFKSIVNKSNNTDEIATVNNITTVKIQSNWVPDSI